MTVYSHDLVTGGGYGLCPWCHLTHKGRLCPLIAAVEFNPDGTIGRVEFHPPQPKPEEE